VGVLGFAANYASQMGRPFANGVEKDSAAVRNAIISTWSNGETKSQITDWNSLNAKCTAAPESIRFGWVWLAELAVSHQQKGWCRTASNRHRGCRCGHANRHEI